MTFRYRTLGIVVNKTERGEADQIFTIYTRDFGKLEILGKSIRKIKSKLRAGAELFNLSEIEFIQGKTYKTLTDAVLIDKFENLRKDLRKLKTAYRISEVLNNLIKGQEEEEKIWQLLNETFQKLNSLNLKSEILNLIYYYFLWSFLSVLGYQIELYNCSLCQKKLSAGRIYFNPKEGWLSCPGCFGKIKEKPLSELKYYQETNSDTVKILRIILKKDWNTLFRLKTKTLDQKMLEDISADFLSAIFPLAQNC